MRRTPLTTTPRRQPRHSLRYLAAHGETADSKVAGSQVDDEDVDATVDRTIATARQHHHGNDDAVRSPW